MGITNALILFCGIQPNSQGMPQVEYDARVNECKSYIVNCLENKNTNEQLNKCIDKYNHFYHPPRECRNKLNGECK